MLFAGCASNEGGLSPVFDAGFDANPDVGLVDADAGDAALGDAVARDTGGPRDAGPRDTGPRDAGPADSAASDATPVDGAADAGPDVGDATPACGDDDGCDDGLTCNGAERCVDGACQGGFVVRCDDGIDCTVDMCVEPSAACVNVPSDARCAPGLVCNGVVEGCAMPAACESDAACDDGLFCNGVETCEPAVGCVTGAAPVCDDGFSCTADRCDSVMDACTSTPVPAACDDGLGCNGGELCDPSSAVAAPGSGCVSGPARSCDDGNACTIDRCVDPVGSCTNTAPAEVCDGLDNDCDGRVDDGFACRLGQSGPCPTSCGSIGTRGCTSSCAWGACVPPSERCGDGDDDDCDGEVDEGCVLPPTNDTCAGSHLLSGRGTTTGTLVGANRDATESLGVCGAGVEVFYRVSLSVQSIVYLDTFGSAVDTRLSYRGTSCPGSISSSDCEDDDCGTTNEQLVRVLAPGDHYFAVHAFGLTTPPGAFTLHHQVQTAAAATDLRITGPGTYSNSTAGAGVSNLSAAGCGGAGPEASYYWTTCPGSPLSWRFATCGTSSLDTVLHLWGPSGQIDCNDDFCGLQSTIADTMSDAGLYVVYVDAFSAGSTGPHTLEISPF